MMAEPLSLTASIITVLQITQSVLSVCYNYNAAFKGSSWELTKVKNELEGFRNVIQAIEPLIREADLSSPPSTRLPSLKALCEPGGVLQSCYADLKYLEGKLEGSTWADGLGPRSKALLQSLRWPLREEDTKKILCRIGRFRSTLALALNVDDTRLTLAMHDLGLESNLNVNIVKDFMEATRGRAYLEDLEKENRSIREWLSAPDPSVNHNRAQQSHHEGTGLWFLESDMFNRWKQQSTLSWLHGIPGSGKTILSSTIIEAIRQDYGSAHDTAVLYFYFDFNDGKKQQPEYMVRSLLSQLLIQCSIALPIMKRLYSFCSKGSSQPDLKALCVVLGEIIQDVGDSFIIIDALDECGERQRLFEVINDIRQHEHRKPHVLVTSRSLPDIEEWLEPLVLSVDRVRVGGVSVDSDILAYINERLQNDQGLKRWKKLPEVQEEIRTTLKEKAGGMFRWTVCQLDTLRNCARLPVLRKALRDLPKSLDETYSRILCSISEECIDDAFNMLQWLVYSREPLHISELAEVVAITMKVGTWVDPEARFTEPNEVFSILSSLVSIEDAPGVSSNANETPIVRFSHFSVQEYLVSDRILTQSARRFAVQRPSATKHIAEACCAYLLHLPDCDSREQCEKNYPLFTHVTEQWVEYLLQLDKENVPCWLILFLMLEIEFFGKYEGPSPYEPLSDLYHSQGPVYDPLNFAAWLGFPKLVKRLLDEGYNIISTSTYDGESVSYSAINGHADEELIRILLAEGSDVNARMERTPFATALQLAVSRRHEPAIRVLLQYGVDVNAQGGGEHQFGSPGGPALFVACLDKHTGIARLLLEHGADVNGNGEIGTPLMAALFNHGDAEELVELLLEYGANVNATTKGVGTALELAISEHPEAVMDRLPKAGADPNLTPEGQNSLIGTVIATSNVAYVQKLLNYGANISGSESSALYLACRSGSLDTVQLLLDSGANVDAQGGPLGTGLHAACFDNHGSVVRLLLHSGASINTPKGRYLSALQAAAASQDPSEQVIDVLLDAGADVNFQGGKYNTGLQAAACGGDSLPRRKEQHLRIAQRLLSKGANVNLIGGRYGTALRAAARCTWFELVEILFKHGAQVTAQDLEFAESCGGISKKTLALFQDAYISQTKAATD
ncbi:MAG: hypothetical protein Q9198_000968 [Flavoplaca austrocitrina]